MQTSIKQAFIKFAIDQDVLRFGRLFTLKSGRKSPYFFNLGLFNTGDSLRRLGQFYADTIVSTDLEFDMLFGPAYKGIPLVSATGIAFAQNNQRDVPICFNRKEAKAHGEGGCLVGAPIDGRVLIVDDVMTAGTAIREAKELIEKQGGIVVGIVIALDRQERGMGEASTIDEVQAQWDVPVVSIITLQDLIDYLKQQSNTAELLSAIHRYQQEYGV